MILSVWPVELTLAYWDRVKKSDRLWFDQGFRHLLTEFEASAEKLKGLKKSTENLKRIDDFKEFKEEFRRILQPCHHNLRLVIDKIDHAKRIDDNDKSGAKIFIIFSESAKAYFRDLSRIKTKHEEFIKLSDSYLADTNNLCEYAILSCKKLLDCLGELAAKKDDKSFEKVVLRANTYVTSMRPILESKYPLILDDIRSLFSGVSLEEWKGPFFELEGKNANWAKKKFEELKEGLSFADGDDVDIDAEISAYVSEFTDARYTVSLFQRSLQALADRTKIAG